MIPGQSSQDGLEVLIDNVPPNVTFNRGMRVQDIWVFTPADFGVVELSLPSDYSGELSIEITAMAAGVSRQRSLIIIVDGNITSMSTTTDGNIKSMSTTTTTATTTTYPNVTEFTLYTTASASDSTFANTPSTKVPSVKGM